MVTTARDLGSDAALVTAAQEGDSEAFAELFRRHHHAVRRACARRLGDLKEADEIAQCAFVRAWERIDQCRGERRFGGWVQVIAHRQCIDALRERGRATPTASPLDDMNALSSTDGPEDSVLRAEVAGFVQLALADLPPRQRDVVVARDLEGRRPGEIAAALGLSLGAVDSLLLRGRRRLATVVERLSNERGAISTTSASSVAAGMASSSPRFAELINSIQDAIARVSYQVAASIGVVPGLAGPVQRGVAAIVVGGAVASGAAIPASAPAAAPIPSAPELAVTPPVLATPPPIAAPATPAFTASPPTPSVAAAPSPLPQSAPVSSGAASAQIERAVGNTVEATTAVLGRLGAQLPR